MYQNYFGFTAEPFSIAPDPHFLFLSDRHQEALAHLSYGMQGSGGFILLTGEVGTGKTTVSRALLEQLDAHTRTAFILNPTLNEHELLATLCDEFGIRYAKRSATIKQLTDKLSQFLLKAHSEGEKCLVLIDEAQHLKPEVLEQLRLLTNLETDQQKLLRVILIGQPELQDLLRRRELRQLAQRITARYHLLPLTPADTARYIDFRLQVAGAGAGIFTAAAIKKLHQASEGIPRRLNVLCDRALLAAYNEHSASVLPKHVAVAVHEVDGGYAGAPSNQPKLGRPLHLVIAGVCAFAVAIGAQLWWQSTTASKPEAADTAPKLSAEQALVKDWQLPKYSGAKPLCEWLEGYQLQCWQGQLRFDQLLALNYPMLLEREGGDWVWIGRRSQAEAPADWTGNALVVWQPPVGYPDEAELYQDWLVEALQQALPAQSNGRTERPLDRAHSQEIYQELQQLAGLPVSRELDAPTLIWLAARTHKSGPRLTGEE